LVGGAGVVGLRESDFHRGFGLNRRVPIYGTKKIRANSPVILLSEETFRPGRPHARVSDRLFTPIPVWPGAGTEKKA